MSSKTRGPFALLLCAFFWGMAFSAQSNAMHYVGPYTFVFLRSLVTCVVLGAVLPLLRKKAGTDEASVAPVSRHILIGGICGTILVAATILQQIGLVTTTPAKSGFVTALYIIIVPIIGMFLGSRPKGTLWIGAILSLIGLYLLCMKGSLSIAIGDLFTLASALVFAVHIVVVDRSGGSLDSILLSTIQFAFAALWAGVLALIIEKPQIAPILSCWKDILFVAVFSGALGYTLQIVGQKDTDPTLAALIMCLESVFAAIGGWVLLGDALSAREMLGCALMLSASIVAQLPEKSREARV